MVSSVHDLVDNSYIDYVPRKTRPETSNLNLTVLTETFLFTSHARSKFNCELCSFFEMVLHSNDVSLFLRELLTY